MYLQLFLVLYLIVQSRGKYRCGKTTFGIRDQAFGIGPKDDGYYHIEPTSCEYRIQAQRDGYYTVLEWDKFDVDDNMPSCLSSSVTVYIRCKKENKVAQFCSLNAQKPFPIISRDGCIRIVLRTDRTFATASFSARYKRFKNSYDRFRACSYNKNLYESSGLIGSPNWPSSYHKSSTICKKCNWYIKMSKKKNVLIVLFDIDIEKDFYDRHGFCSTSFNDLVGFKTSYHFSYDNKICSLEKPKLLTYYTEYLHVTMWKIEEVSSETNRRGRGIVLGYMKYGKPVTRKTDKVDVSRKKEKINVTRKTDTVDVEAIEEEGGISTDVIVILSIIGLLFLCGYFYICKDNYESGSNNANVRLIYIQPSTQIATTEEDESSYNHEMLHSEETPMCNPELSVHAPPSYAHVQSQQTVPSVSPIQPTSSTGYIDAPPPSYDDFIQGNYDS